MIWGELAGGMNWENLAGGINFRLGELTFPPKTQFEAGGINDLGNLGVINP